MILEELEIFGFSQAREHAIFASLLLGDPILFIGPPGTAKTEVVAAIGAALRESSKRENPDNSSSWFNYQIYDASKLNFEDLVGYPNVSKMKGDSPKVEYIPTKSTIWNKQMISFDEINRCAEDRQSNLFEIIRSRKLHGIETNNLFISGTMNPYGDTGTVETSDALMDRFLFYVHLEDFSKMNNEDMHKVIRRRGPVDSVGITYWGNVKSDLATSDTTINNKLADVGDKIKSLMTSAAIYLKDYQESIGQPVTEIVAKVVQIFDTEFTKNNKQELRISGRRAAMMMRGALAIRAIEAANSDSFSLADTISSLSNSLKICLPIGLSGKLETQLLDRASEIIDSTVQTMWPLVSVKQTLDLDSVITATHSKNPILILSTLLNTELNQMTRDKICNKLVTKENYINPISNQVDEQVFRYVKGLLYFLNQKIPNFIPSHIKIDLTSKDIEDIQKQENMGFLNEESAKYSRLILHCVRSLDGNPLLQYTARVAFCYLTKNITNDEDAVREIQNMITLLHSVEKQIKLIVNDKDTSPTSS